MLENTAVADAKETPAPDPAHNGDAVVVETQFGEIAFPKESIIRFPTGLLGFSGQAEFGLANLPDPSYGNFKLMQCLDGSGLAFLVLPMEALPDVVAEADLNDAFDALGIDAESRAALLIVTVRKVDEAVKLSVNLRAPILIDVAEKRAFQHVLANANYSIRHEL